MRNIQDIASLREWFRENETHIISYIESRFERVSHAYQFNLMLEHLIFTKAVIDDAKLTQEQKIDELIEAIKFGKSKIILVVGSRGAGKTASALFLAEAAHELGGHEIIYYVGEPAEKESYPKWIKFVKLLDDLPNNSYALIDEAAIKYNARKSRTSENMELTEKMVILRHKGITLVLITQNIMLLEINCDRLADIIIYKMSPDYGFRRKKGEMMTKMFRERMLIINRLRPRTKEECMAEYKSGAASVFRKFCTPLPSFWTDGISKSFKKFVKTEQVKQAEQIYVKPKPKLSGGIS